MLKQFDLFRQPIQLYTSSKDKKSRHFFGSYIGLFLSACVSLLCLAYFISLSIRMYNYEDDQFSSQSLPNDFKQGFLIKNFNFMISFEIRQYSFEPEAFEILKRIQYEDSDEIDPQKLKRYIKIKTSAQNRENGKETYSEKDFQQCTENDFLSKNLTKYISLKNRYCMQVEDDLQIRNGYANPIRQSFAVMIEKCQNSTIQSCENDQKIEEVLNNVYFTMYTIESNVRFTDYETYGGNPIKGQEKFLSQFQLSLDKYIDNNNNLIHSKVETLDERFLIFKRNEYDFLKISPLPVWTSGQYIEIYELSFDGGVTFESVQSHILFGTYFFLSEDMNVHQRKVKNFFDLISQVGGLLATQITIFGLVGNFLNRRLYLVKIVKNLYFFQQGKNFEKLKISFFDGLSDYKLLCTQFRFCRRRVKFTQKQKLFHKARGQAHKEMDVVHILKTIQKLKAGLSAVVGNNMQVIKKSQIILRSSILIGLDTVRQNEFLKFMNADDNYFQEINEEAKQPGGIDELIEDDSIPGTPTKPQPTQPPQPPLEPWAEERKTQVQDDSRLSQNNYYKTLVGDEVSINPNIELSYRKKKYGEYVINQRGQQRSSQNKFISLSSLQSDISYR